MVIFRQWNNNRFKNPISIARDEVMRAAKIGSVNTYTKALKQLHHFQYIRYEPSFNPHIGSRIYLYTFEKANGQSIDNAGEIEMSPLLNIENSTNNSNQKYKNTHAQNLENQFEPIKKKMNPNPDTNPNDIPPQMEHLIIYFNEKEFSAIEAEKFHNHFQSNGWLVGGKSKMKDWKAAARNWMLNANKFQPKSNAPQPNHLHTLNSKNYAEPL
jgi:hypothetical protein